MLEPLLSEIRSGGTLEVSLLASRLQTTPQMVAAMLEHLQRAGYIRPYQTCGDGCGGCSLKSECSPPQRGDSLRLWQG